MPKPSPSNYDPISPSPLFNGGIQRFMREFYHGDNPKVDTRYENSNGGWLDSPPRRGYHDYGPRERTWESQFFDSGYGGRDHAPSRTWYDSPSFESIHYDHAVDDLGLDFDYDDAGLESSDDLDLAVMLEDSALGDAQPVDSDDEEGLVPLLLGIIQLLLKGSEE